MWVTTKEGQMVNLAHVEKIAAEGSKVQAYYEGGQRWITLTDKTNTLKPLAESLTSHGGHLDLRNL